MSEAPYRSQSFWLETVDEPLVPRAPLEAQREVDVAIVGAGLTGLWTAYYLKTLDSDLQIAIVEAEIAGFGASGRNGGWCLGTVAGMANIHQANPEAAQRLQHELIKTLDEVERVCRVEQLDCHWARGGNITVATSDPFLQQLREELRFWRRLGVGEDRARLLDAKQCSNLIGTKTNLGGLFFEPVAALHPARLVRGLAKVVEDLGVTLYERSPVSSLGNRSVVSSQGQLDAKVVVRATEGYSKTIPGHHKSVIPVHSMMIATEPLPSEVWGEIGLENRETFGDPRRNVTYGQRTADDRIAFGCRGAYYFGSRIKNRFPSSNHHFEQVRQVLESFFPVLEDYRITHRWGGALGIPRSWSPSIGFDRETGLAWAGGYVGEGVGPTNLAGRTLADLILDRDSHLRHLPLVDAPQPSWEPEPLRYLGYTALSRVGERLDQADIQGRHPPAWQSAIYDRFVRK